MSAAKLEFSINQIELTSKDFAYFAKKIYELAGIHLPSNDKNISLVQNRLSRLLRRHELSSYSALADKIEKGGPLIIDEFISSLTTNKTHFFREEAHFEFLEKELPNHFKDHNELRIWCAASSTGQEPYTLAITLLESLSSQQASRSRILATDIDTDILAKAAAGEYSEQEMQGLDAHLRQKYFLRQASKDKSFRAADSISSMIDFARFNLITGNYKFNKPFDFIFCRNVLIYFDPPTTRKVIESLGKCLRPGGHLIIGHSESGTQVPADLKGIAQAVYRKERS